MALLPGLAFSAAVGALPFNAGEVEGQFDSQFSMHSLWSTASPDARLVGNLNGGRGWSQAGDDGRLNHRRGDRFSSRFQGLHELELRYRDHGVALSGRYWYDFAEKDGDRRHKPIDDSGRQVAAQASGAEFLEAFYFHHHALGEQPGALRVGRQTVHWGESQFIAGGIDAINPRDHSRPLNPSHPLRETARPVELAYVSQSINRRLVLDLFYQLAWRPDVLANCGTFFSQADGLARGCVDQDVMANLMGAPGQGLESSSGEGVRLRRGADREARDDGQFGLALHGVGDRADYGLYLLNYHSRSGLFSSRTDASAAFAEASPQARAEAAERGEYWREFAEDIRLYGVSVATWLPAGIRWSSELSYRPNAPLQINRAELVRRLGDPAYAGLASPGYARKEVTQLVSSFSQVLDRVGGFDGLELLAEFGYVRVGGLDEQGYGRDPLFGLGGGGGLVTRSAWGYRLQASSVIRNLWPRIDLLPSLGFSHDVRGFAPDGVFSEGAKAVSLGAQARYLDTYSLAVEYVNFFGGRYNILVDRDYLGVSLGLAF
ncbi:DUF1302 domain-containing protein [Stutzerimonas tarimensis]|uniref:DUF1302 domain-containing protein n=1 Tax=Stutzerimonas tarimensis TaxID=1507735 RepID=A0ABV7T1B0_9GAMM